MIRAALLIVLLLPFPVNVLAGWQRSIHVEWGYTPPSVPAVAGFRLYQEGKPVCTWSDANIVAGDCTVTLEKQTTSYTLTAMFADGQESQHSAAYSFTAPEIVLTAPAQFRVGL